MGSDIWDEEPDWAAVHKRLTGMKLPEVRRIKMKCFSGMMRGLWRKSDVICHMVNLMRYWWHMGHEANGKYARIRVEKILNEIGWEVKDGA